MSASRAAAAARKEADIVCILVNVSSLALPPTLSNDPVQKKPFQSGGGRPHIRKKGTSEAVEDTSPIRKKGTSEAVEGTSTPIRKKGTSEAVEVTSTPSEKRHLGSGGRYLDPHPG